MTKRPFAVFDIDGTVIRWQLYHALADELARTGHLDPKGFEKVRQARMMWKNRARETSFEDYEQTLVALIDEAITGITTIDLEAACRRVIDVYKDQVYTFTRDLIRDLQSKNYLLFAISASQEQIVGLIAEYYGFDDFGGSHYEVKGGYFTGRKELLLSEAKPKFLKQLVAKHDADWQGSYAVGDSDGDIPMLSAVENPIAFNPTKKLFRHAAEQGWNVVVERKNMVYRLEPKDGTYLLV